jgi:Ca2+/Na+ antiporter
MVSILLSVGRGQLTTFDSWAAVALVMSPTTVELVSTALFKLCRLRRSRPHPESRSTAVIYLSLLIWPLLLVITVVTTFSTTAFLDSNVTRTGDRWLLGLIYVIMPLLCPRYLFYGYYSWIITYCAYCQYLLLLTWAVCLARHQGDSRNLQQKWQKESLEPLSTWSLWKQKAESRVYDKTHLPHVHLDESEIHRKVITASHPWLMGLSILFSLTCWVGTLALVVGKAERGYIFSYGQVRTLPSMQHFHCAISSALLQAMATFSAIPPVVSVLRVWHRNWDTFISFIHTSLPLFWDSIIFLVTGYRNPWKLHTNSPLDTPPKFTSSALPTTVPFVHPPPREIIGVVVRGDGASMSVSSSFNLPLRRRTHG